MTKNIIASVLLSPEEKHGAGMRHLKVVLSVTKRLKIHDYFYDQFNACVKACFHFALMSSWYIKRITVPTDVLY